MSNYKFDLDEWLPRLPLPIDRHMANRDNKGRPHPLSGQIITGPCEICLNEHLRRELSDQIHWGRAVPMDFFVMADGEPMDRHVTKVGGLPYRPLASAWPVSSDGRRMTFFGQFCFSDSKDLVGELPGDVLLVFCGSPEYPVESMAFEWQPLGLTDLIAPETIPQQPWPISPCYGHVCRVHSYPDADRIPELASEEYLSCQGIPIWSEHFLYQYHGTQIGTAPYFIQGNPDLPGRLLCTLSSVQPNQHKPYPWVNRAEPLRPENEWRHDDQYLMLGDVGCIYISIDDHGDLHFAEDCY